MIFLHRHVLWQGRRREFSLHSSQDHQVRVRFAPSPTGELHLGGYRTALYNYLFARQRGGKMVLRIEDTDRTRKVEGAEERLLESLQWGGVSVDEGPAGIGGGAGPYRQSERLELYRKASGRLLATGAAYRCFCTERRLELLRRDNARRRAPNRYDGRCAGLSGEESEERALSGEPHVVRLRLLPATEPFDDLVFGLTLHDVAAVEGDPVILKSDGFPTYHLACVVDDHHMGITHVLRGCEWAVSTPKHLTMYRALGWEPPQFAHLPLLLNQDGTKLSKRQGDADLGSLCTNGFYPEAVLNYATLVGGGFRDRERDHELLLSMSELEERFSLQSVATHSARVDPVRLRSLNRTALKSRLDGREKQVLENMRGLLLKNGFKEAYSDDHLIRVVAWAQDRIDTLQDFFGTELRFLWTRPTQLSLPGPLTLDLVVCLGRQLEASLPERENLREAAVASLRQFCKEEGLKFSLVTRFLRTVLIGSNEGPPVGEIFEVLGKETAVQRIREGIELLSRTEKEDVTISQQ